VAIAARTTSALEVLTGVFIVAEKIGGKPVDWTRKGFPYLLHLSLPLNERIGTTRVRAGFTGDARSPERGTASPLVTQQSLGDRNKW
jgi:hypothetical protein